MRKFNRNYLFMLFRAVKNAVTSNRYGGRIDGLD